MGAQRADAWQEGAQGHLCALRRPPCHGGDVHWGIHAFVPLLMRMGGVVVTALCMELRMLACVCVCVCISNTRLPAHALSHTQMRAFAKLVLGAAHAASLLE